MPVKKMIVMGCHSSNSTQIDPPMEGIYADDYITYGINTPCLTRDTSLLGMQYGGCTDAEDANVVTYDATYLQLPLVMETPGFFTEMSFPDIVPTTPSKIIGEKPGIPGLSDSLSLTDQTEAQKTPSRNTEMQCDSLSLTNQAEAETTPSTNTGIQTALEWGYTTPTAMPTAPIRLNKRGLPMRHSAMQVADRVKEIVNWETANDDSAAVREIASAIDNEITRESSQKRMRKTDVEPLVYDSEMSDNADGGESEGENESEPDVDDVDTDFVVPDDNEEEEEDEAVDEDEEIDISDDNDDDGSDLSEPEDEIEESEDDEDEEGQSEDETDYISAA
jgi:hypothetical protein